MKPSRPHHTYSCGFNKKITQLDYCMSPRVYRDVWIDTDNFLLKACSSSGKV